MFAGEAGVVGGVAEGAFEGDKSSDDMNTFLGL